MGGGVINKCTLWGNPSKGRYENNMMTQGVDDRRRHLRRDVTLCAWLRFRGEKSPRCTRSCDLTREGARFVTLRPVAVGEPVLITLALSGTQSLECKGVVRWCRMLPNRMYEFGVRFLDLHDEEYERLDEVMAVSEAAEAALV